MSDHSNSPIQEISIEELYRPHISVDRTHNKVYLFWGKTPRAQIVISATERWDVGWLLQLAQNKFPDAEVSYQ